MFVGIGRTCTADNFTSMRNQINAVDVDVDVDVADAVDAVASGTI